MKKLLIILVSALLFISCASMGVESPAEITLENMYDTYYKYAYRFPMEEADRIKYDLKIQEEGLKDIQKQKEDNNGVIPEDQVEREAKLKNNIYTINNYMVEWVKYYNSEDVSQSLINIGQIWSE